MTADRTVIGSGITQVRLLPGAVTTAESLTQHLFSAARVALPRSAAMIFNSQSTNPTGKLNAGVSESQ